MLSQLHHEITQVFWEMLGWHLLHTAAPEQSVPSPWQWWPTFKSKNNAWRFWEGNCAGARAHEIVWVTKLMVIKACPSNLGGRVGLPAQDGLHCWALGVRSPSTHFFLKDTKWAQCLSCHWSAHTQHLQMQVPCQEHERPPRTKLKGEHVAGHSLNWGSKDRLGKSQTLQSRHLSDFPSVYMETKCSYF